jgi:uncharacterized membrane protein YphA (DoxX/SURF4 family)
MNIATWWFIFIGVVIVVGLILTLTQRATRANPQGGSWGVGTRFFLVTLRLAIGWHILFEGFEKRDNPSWSSEAYLREATGPLAPKFREIAGDALIDRLTPSLFREPGQERAQEHFPVALDRDWQLFFTNFQKHYQISDLKGEFVAAATVGALGSGSGQAPLVALTTLQGPQNERARLAFELARARAEAWIVTDLSPVKLNSPYPPDVKVDKKMQDRIKEYQAAERNVRDIEQTDLPAFGTAAYDKLAKAKKEANDLRASLKSDLAKHTASMRAGLLVVLTPQQRTMPPPPDTVQWPIGAWGKLEWANAIVTYGLLAVGACLLLGVLTRTACLAGAAFLLLFYLAIPALPDWPAPPRLEGFYLYVNKTLIEMFALLTLATTRSGRWFGLDGLLQFLRPGAWRSASPVPRPGRNDIPDKVVPAPTGKSPAHAITT